MVDFRFVVVSKEQINMMKENAIPKSTKVSEVWGDTFRRQDMKVLLTVTETPLKLRWKCCSRYVDRNMK